MTNKFEKALEFVNYRSTVNNKKSEMRVRVQSLLSYSVGGGTFTVGPELIVFVKYLADLNKTSAVLLDNFNNPVEIEVQSFLEEITSRYFEVTNQYHAEYTQLRRARSIPKVLDIND